MKTKTGKILHAYSMNGLNAGSIPAHGAREYLNELNEFCLNDSGERVERTTYMNELEQKRNCVK